MPHQSRYLLDLPTAIKLDDHSVSVTPDNGDAGYEIAFSKATAVTCHLPPVVEAGNGFTLVVRNIGAGDLTVDPNGNEQLDGLASVTLKTDEWRWIRCDGSSWASVSQGVPGGGGTGSGVLSYLVSGEPTGALLSCASGGTPIDTVIPGVPIPETGIIRVTMMSGVLGETQGSEYAYFGLSIDVDNGVYFFPTTGDAAGNTFYPPSISVQPNTTVTIGGGADNGSTTTTMINIADLASGLTLPGTYDVKVRVGVQAYAPSSSNGTITNGVFLVEVIEAPSMTPPV